MMATTMLLLWAVTAPLLSAAVFAAGLGLALGARRLLALARCLADCGGFALDVGDSLRVCVTRPSATEAC